MRFTWWCMWRNARYGLRGVRVGEASHPGPPRVGLRRLRTCATTIDSVCPTEADSEATLSAAPVASGIHQRRIPSSDSVPLRGNRFAVLGEPEAEVEVRPRRRLVLVSQHSNDRQPLDEWDSDTDTVGGVSDAEVTEVVEPTVEEVPVLMDARVRAPVRAFTSLDAINLTDLFEHRPKLMQSVPHILRGAFRLALRVACQEILDGMEANCEVRTLVGVASDDVVSS